MTALVIAVLFVDVLLLVNARLNKDSLTRALQKVIPHEFTVEDIAISAGGEVRIKGLVVYDSAPIDHNPGPDDAGGTKPTSNTPSETGARQELLRLPLVSVKVDVLGLIAGGQEVRSIELRDPVVHFRQLADGAWNVSSLFTRTGKALGVEAPPTVSIVNATAYIESDRIFRAGHVQRLDGCTFEFKPLGHSSTIVEGKLWAAGLGKWTVTGRLDASQKEYELTARSEGLVLADEVGALFAPEINSAWNNYRPRGPASVSVMFQTTRAPDNTCKSTYAVDVGLEGVSVKCKGFPYEIGDGRGNIRFLEGGAEMYGLRGRTGPMSMTFSGHTNGYDSDAGFELDIGLRNLPVDEKLYDALDADSREVWDLLSPGGMVDVASNVVREFGDNKPVANNMTVACTDASVQVRDFPYKVSGLEGELRFSPGKIQILKLRSRSGSRVIDAEGMIESADGRRAFDVLVNARSLPLDADLRAACDDDIRRIWDKLSPSGTVDVVWNVRSDGKEGSVAQHDVRIHCNGVSATHADYPYPFESIEGDATVDGKRLRFDRLKGKNGESMVEISGHIALKEEDKPLSLEMKGKDMAFSEQTVNALPVALRKAVQDVGMTGKFDFTARLDEQKPRKEGASGSVTSYLVELVLADCSVDLGLKLSDISGRATIRGAQGLPPESAFGNVRLSNVSAQGKQFTDVSAQFLYAADNLTLNDVRAGAYSGLLSGYFRINTDTKEFDTSCVLQGLDLKEYVRHTKIAGKQMSGKMDGSFTLKGKGSDSSQLWGEGNLSIANGYLWDVPLFLEMVNFFSLKKRQPFTEGSARLKIRGRTVIVREVQFSNEDITMLGTGKIDFDGNQLLRFKTHFSTSILPSIDVLTKVWELIRDNIAMVEASGTFDEPKLAIKPLPAVFGTDDEIDKEK
ncbi:MAG: AsmA-like C-terminal region-containing protein [Planctomycetota bacterium]|nr:AsmA-like C-terminal region-containing protein [Planctomycetota bacterium]